MEEGKKGEAEAQAISKRNILRDIKYLTSKGVISGHEVYYLIKNFLRGYLKLEYEFTKDELFKELKNVYLPYNIRSDFFNFIERIFTFEYSNVTYSDDELRDFLEEFKGYLDYLFITTQEKGKTGGQIIARKWGDKIRGLFKSDSKAEVSEQKDKEVEATSLKVMDPVKAHHVDINSLIEKIYYSLYNSDLRSAKELYRQAIVLYNKLPSNEKITYFDTIHSVYDSLKKSSPSS